MTKNNISNSFTTIIDMQDSIFFMKMIVYITKSICRKFFVGHHLKILSIYNRILNCM